MFSEGRVASMCFGAVSAGSLHRNFRMKFEIFRCASCQTFNVMLNCLLCPGGGIGRRARFRSVYRKMWRFEFSPGHQNYSIQKKPLPTSGFSTFRARSTVPNFLPKPLLPGAVLSKIPADTFAKVLQLFQTGMAIRSCPWAPTMRARVNSPTLSVLLIFSGGSSLTTPSISGASA